MRDRGNAMSVQAEIEGSIPRYPLGRKGRFLPDTRQLPIRELKEYIGGDLHLTLADLCAGIPQTDRPGPERGVKKSGAARKEYECSVEDAFIHTFGKKKMPTPPGKPSKTGRMRLMIPPCQDEWRMCRKGRVAWAMSAEEPELGKHRRKRVEPPIPVDGQRDRLQKERDHAELIEVVRANAQGPHVFRTSAGVPPLLPTLLAGHEGSVYEILKASQQAPMQLRAASRDASVRFRDNVASLLRLDPPAPPASLPLQLIRRARPKPPFDQDEAHINNFIAPQRISAEFKFLRVPTGDGIGPARAALLQRSK
ncbi:hypothetical protein DIPPA_15911 [Diplonema papillatum]|nr:hypothetical protein DIPPA_15911 [Diplonema papillatum]